MSPGFERFVAVDWSGARGWRHRGLAVAECRPGSEAPALVPPPGGAWSRSFFVDWLVGCRDEGRRLLVGIDCAFALPAAAGERLLGGVYEAAELWDRIDLVCDGAADLFGGGFAEAAQHRDLFWHAGKRPPGFVEHRRGTESACRAAGLGAPESPLKLVGAKQVGKGGLAGMRALAALRRRLGGDAAIWPFDPVDGARIVLVELYPRLFLRLAAHGNGKVRARTALDRCLEALGSDPYRAEDDRLSDHDTDALVAAAGLRLLAGEDAVWQPPGLDAVGRRAEGWIFGVP